MQRCGITTSYGKRLFRVKINRQDNLNAAYVYVQAPFDLIQSLIGADTRDSRGISRPLGDHAGACYDEAPYRTAESERLKWKSNSRMIKTLPISMYKPHLI
ncbi:hypothetical protein [Heyndrickxia acidicola]|uniref:hypothetical protein n=1 Tax=Heyndrickxia acidicola TaxID=209389 RepID=UPI000826DE9E|nr:hypothetical protein [Heyndrickxia acidicola]